MKCPCKDCLTLGICKGKIGNISQLEIEFCPLVENYIYSKEIMSKRPMYRKTRINKIRMVLGMGKKKGRH
jgi:hypothetical protein